MNKTMTVEDVVRRSGGRVDEEQAQRVLERIASAVSASIVDVAIAEVIEEDVKEHRLRIGWQLVDKRTGEQADGHGSYVILSTQALLETLAGNQKYAKDWRNWEICAVYEGDIQNPTFFGEWRRDEMPRIGPQPDVELEDEPLPIRVEFPPLCSTCGKALADDEVALLKGCYSEGQFFPNVGEFICSACATK